MEDEYTTMDSTKSDKLRIEATQSTKDLLSSGPMIFRYRADSMASEDSEVDKEHQVWKCFESIFCFLKGVSVYHCRRRLMFIIIAQGLLSTIRILPIILGLNYRSTLPLFILFVTLILGWHGVKFLVPKYLLFYKVGMQVTLVIDSTWYVLQWNGTTGTTVSQGTAFWLQAFISSLLVISSILGLLYGWKLRDIVKSVEHHRGCERATLAEIGSTTALPHSNSMRSSGRFSEVGRLSSHSVVVEKSREFCAGDPSCMFRSNEIIRSKYTYYNFLFVFFKLQFSRLANVYTCVVVFLCFFEFSPVSPISSLTPLLIVFGTSAMKDVFEDMQRKREDSAVNDKNVIIARSNSDTTNTTWRKVQVGDIVKLKQGDEACSDMLLLSTSRSDGRCYVATANLDGETNLKIRNVVPSTKDVSDPMELLKQHSLLVSCDAPSANLFQFNGTLTLQSADKSEIATPVDMDNLILRGSSLHSSEWTFGLVIYTGIETRVALNAAETQLKRSRVEKRLNSMLVLILVLLFTISVACSLGNNDWNYTIINSFPRYLRASQPLDDSSTRDYIFLSFVILFNNMIPLSMYVTMEGVRFAYAKYINNDLEMYDEDTDTPAHARNSNIVEDLGQIQYIFSDKTGTLTQNEMVFKQCSINGIRYGSASTDDSKDLPSYVKGSRFYDDRIHVNSKEKTAQNSALHEFALMLLLCNSVVPTYDEKNGTIFYDASSPDEEALVAAASSMGYILKSRNGNVCNVTIHGKNQEWTILATFEFDSDRKRMSVICTGPDKRIRLFCKGADNVIMDRLTTESRNELSFLTLQHLKEYASQGLRTLSGAMRYLDETEYGEFAESYDKASLTVQGRAYAMEHVAATVESGLTLLGATAIEDQLQEGVQDCISSLREAGISFWVLTGDKQETAVSIGMSSNVIDDNMDVIVLNQTDKALLIAKLEELYVDLVEEKWQEEDEGMCFVLWKGCKDIVVAMYNSLILSITGKPNEKKQCRRRRCADNAHDGNYFGDDEVGNRSFSFEHRMPDLSEIIVDSGKDNATSNDCLLPSDLMHPIGSSPNANSVGDQKTISSSGDLEYAMVIDGETLAYLLENDIKYLFLAVARTCKSVICCRCSPAQKASVVSLMTQPRLMWGPGFLSLAIGDGANDVPMIQSANVGIGISGKEGRQAVLSSDYSIAKFKYLKRLLLVHGSFSYKRISKLILFSFMKNMSLSISNFWFAVQTRYSGVLMYFGIYFTMYNALFTTIPIVILALYDQDVSAQSLMQNPVLYKSSMLNRSFNWRSFFGWCCLGVWHAYVCFVTAFSGDGYYRNYTISVNNAEARSFNGVATGVWANGVASYTYIILASTLQVSLLTRNWTMYNFGAVGGTLVFYVIFTALFSSIYSWTEVDLYETAAASYIFFALIKQPWFWLGLILAPITSVLPNFISRAGRVLFYPEVSHIMREREKLATKFVDTADQPRKRVLRQRTGYAFSQQDSSSKNRPTRAQTIRS